MRELFYKLIVILLLSAILYMLVNMYNYGGKSAVRWAGEYYQLKYKYDKEVEYHSKLYEIQMDVFQCMYRFDSLNEKTRSLWTVSEYCLDNKK